MHGTSEFIVIYHNSSARSCKYFSHTVDELRKVLSKTITSLLGRTRAGRQGAKHSCQCYGNVHCEKLTYLFERTIIVIRDWLVSFTLEDRVKGKDTFVCSLTSPDTRPCRVLCWIIGVSKFELVQRDFERLGSFATFDTVLWP